MKIKWKRIALVVLINTLINVILPHAVLADDAETIQDFKTALDTDEDFKDCIELPTQEDYDEIINQTKNIQDKDERNQKIEELTDNLTQEFPAMAYLITIIEEPLDAENYGEIGIDDTISRICYRNSFIYFGTEKEGNKRVERKIDGPELSNKCSTKAAQIAAEVTFSETGLDEKDRLNPRYTCKKVQVLLTKGGATTIQAYIGTVYRWGASVAGLIAVVVIILNGIRISLAGGDTQAIENAKNRILQSIGGLVILFLSGLILYTINPNFFIR